TRRILVHAEEARADTEGGGGHAGDVPDVRVGIVVDVTPGRPTERAVGVEAGGDAHQVVGDGHGGTSRRLRGVDDGRGTSGHGGDARAGAVLERVGVHLGVEVGNGSGRGVAQLDGVASLALGVVTGVDAVVVAVAALRVEADLLDALRVS